MSLPIVPDLMPAFQTDGEQMLLFGRPIRPVISILPGEISMHFTVLTPIGVGLDLSTKSTGWFRVPDGDFEHGHGQVITTTATERRDYYMAQRVIDALRILPDLQWVCVEDIYLGKNVSTLLQLHAIRVRVEDWCHEHLVEVIALKTAQIDSYCGIPGGLRRPARKRATREFARRLFGELPEDAADALCCAYAGYHVRRQQEWMEQDKL